MVSYKIRVKKGEGVELIDSNQRELTSALKMFRLQKNEVVGLTVTTSTNKRRS